MQKKKKIRKSCETFLGNMIWFTIHNAKRRKFILSSVHYFKTKTTTKRMIYRKKNRTKQKKNITEAM